MIRIVALSFVLAFPPLAAFAQSETVEVDGKETLSGLWKISFPAGASGYMPGRGRVISTGVESFCRLQQTGEHVSAICLPGWGPDSGDGELDGKDLHLAWGIALARAVIDAKIESASVRTFDGAFAFKVFGIQHDAPTPASARKLVLDPVAPDAAGKANLPTRTLEELAAGAIVTPHDADVVLNFGQGIDSYKPNTPEEIRNLGKWKRFSIWAKAERCAPDFPTRMRHIPSLLSPFLPPVPIRSNSTMAKGYAVFTSMRMACWTDFSVFNLADGEFWRFLSP